MKIAFVDKITKEPAKLDIDGTQFVIDENGDVLEFIEQGYASYYALTTREDVEWILFD